MGQTLLWGFREWWAVEVISFFSKHTINSDTTPGPGLVTVDLAVNQADSASLASGEPGQFTVKFAHGMIETLASDT